MSAKTYIAGAPDGLEMTEPLVVAIATIVLLAVGTAVCRRFRRVPKAQHTTLPVRAEPVTRDELQEVLVDVVNHAVDRMLEQTRTQPEDETWLYWRSTGGKKLHARPDCVSLGQNGTVLHVAAGVAKWFEGRRPDTFCSMCRES